MGMSHDEKMLDRPWLARHAMARHEHDFEVFRKRFLRSFEVRRLYERLRLADAAGHDTTELLEKLQSAKAVGDVDPIVTVATHERLNKRPAPAAINEVLVMRAMRDDRIRRDLHTVFRQQSRWYSYGAIVLALVLAWGGLGWAWRNTDSLRATYQAAIINYQNAQPKSLREKATDLVGFGKKLVADEKASIKEKLDEHRASNAQKETDLINEIRRKRGE